MQAHNGFRCHDDILSSSSNNFTLLLFLPLFSTNVFTDVPTITWNLASDLLTIKLLVEYPFQKDYIMNWNFNLSRKLGLASLQNYYLSNGQNTKSV